MNEELIQIKRDGTKLCVKLTGGPLNYWFNLSYECGDEVYAELLASHFRNKLRSLIEDIRKDEYEAGYKDGRAKRAKKQYFFSVLRRIC